MITKAEYFKFKEEMTKFYFDYVEDMEAFDELGKRMREEYRCSDCCGYSLCNGEYESDSYWSSCDWIVIKKYYKNEHNTMHSLFDDSSLLDQHLEEVEERWQE
jgi:hypothetical protein